MGNKQPALTTDGRRHFSLFKQVDRLVRLRNMLSPPARKPCLPLGCHWRRFVHLCLALLALCAITEPRVHAQISQNNWNGSVEVSMSTLTVREGERISYSVRLTQPPTEDADQNWWVMLQVDGARRGDGHYKGIGWIPSLGREFNGSNWNQWLDFTIEAKEDDDTLDATFTLAHEIWDHNADCPVHGVGTVTVHVIDNDGDEDGGGGSGGGGGGGSSGGGGGGSRWRWWIQRKWRWWWIRRRWRWWIRRKWRIANGGSQPS